MDRHAATQSDGDYVQWHGSSHVVARPAIKAEVRDFDKTRITFGTEREMCYWTDELRVTIYEIRDAIAATGSRCATDVRNYLARLSTRSESDLTA